jgi:hypothetical protein
MKSLSPSKKNKLIFSIIFNIIMLSVYYFSASITWKSLVGNIFINFLILSNWLPKTVEEMDEREKILYLKCSSDLFSFSGIIITTVFCLHIIFFQNMSVIDFMMFTGFPIVGVMSWRSILLKNELADTSV